LSFETVTSNVSGGVRRVTWGGRPHLVAPVTILVSGVLNGSKGRLYYPPEEVSADPEVWNHMPLVVYHPLKDGRPVSAREPWVLEKQGVGFLFNVRARDRGRKLGGEAWFDEEKARLVDSRVLDALEAGTPIELSTGLFTTNDPAPEGARDDRGRPYDFVARDYRPDHLAILPDQRGACSVGDGCGVLVNSAAPTCNCGGDAGCSCGCAGAVWDEFRAPAPADLFDTPHGAGPTEDVVSNLLVFNSDTPSAELDMTPEKACQILKDGTVHGKPLTEAQRGMFGAKCGEREKKGKGATKNSEWALVPDAPAPAPAPAPAATAANAPTAPAPTANAPAAGYEYSDEEKRAELFDQLMERFTKYNSTPARPFDGPGYDAVAPASMPQLVAVYPDYVVFRNEGKYWSLAYEETDAGCRLSDAEPSEVEQVIRYVPVDNSRPQTASADPNWQEIT
jgi:hypothetical protein